MVWLEVWVLERLFDSDTFTGGKSETATHEVERVRLGFWAHLTNIATTVERQRAEVISDG